MVLMLSEPRINTLLLRIWANRITHSQTQHNILCFFLALMSFFDLLDKLPRDWRRLEQESESYENKSSTMFSTLPPFAYLSPLQTPSTSNMSLMTFSHTTSLSLCLSFEHDVANEVSQMRARPEHNKTTLSFDLATAGVYVRVCLSPSVGLNYTRVAFDLGQTVHCQCSLSFSLFALVSHLNKESILSPLQ